MRAVVALDAVDQFADRLGLVALRLELGLDDQPLAAFGFFRARRPVRHPDLAALGFVAKFLAALAQQLVERLRGGGDAHRAQAAARCGRSARGRRYFGSSSPPLRSRAAAGMIAPLTPPARFSARLSPSKGRVKTHSSSQAQFLRQLRIEPGDRRGGVIALRRLIEALSRRLARLVGGGKIGAAVERIVRRRLQVRIFAGAGTQARGALVDRRIEQVGERIGRRRLDRPRRLGARRFRGVLFVFAAFWGVSPSPEYGASPRRGKGGGGRRTPQWRRVRDRAKWPTEACNRREYE